MSRRTASGPPPGQPGQRRRQRRTHGPRWSARVLVALVDGVVVSSMAGVYVATQSLALTVFGGVLAVALTGWLVLIDR